VLAYLGKQSVKDTFLSRVRQHREADEIVQGYGYWQDGKGCAVGCTIHIDGDGNPHEQYETQLGIPSQIARLEDAIFEGLPTDLAKLWPERFLTAIKPGADISRVWHQFASWLLSDSQLLTITDENREAISAVVRLHAHAAAGEQPSEAAWSAASEAAWSAASAAASDAASEAAWSAARAAAYAAARDAASEAASEAAWSAASSAAYVAMSDKLIELLQAAT
jgi:hypothetical protein